MDHRSAWVGFALVVAGCIEGVDPNECALDDDCSGGRLCSRMNRCEQPDDLVDLTVHWTFTGVTPTAAAPGRCVEFDTFMIGAGVGQSGFADSAACEAGTAQLTRVPVQMTTISASGYRNVANGGVMIVDSAEVDRAAATDVTLDF